MIDKKKVKELLVSGKTLVEVAIIVGCTGSRIGQIARRLGLREQDYGYGLRRKLKNEVFVKHLKDTYGRDSWKMDDLGRARSQCFIRKRQSAKYSGKWLWDLLPKDITWPTHCPILGLELNYFAEKREENSPSFDRIDPSKGYIKGNVEILSWRANRIKNDGTKEEHELIAKYMAQKN